MVGSYARVGFIVLLAAIAQPASAAPVPNEFFFPTGNAEKDINRDRFPNAVIATDNLRFPDDLTNDVAQQDFITNRGGITGWNYKDIRLAYNPATDEAGIAINFFKNPDLSPINIAGDADGDGDPGRTDPMTAALGGVDLPNLSGSESITLAIDTNSDGVPDIIAGVPAEKTGSGIEAFTVAKSLFTDPTAVDRSGIERSYGETLTNHLGALNHNPSADQPDFEFTIRNFSQLPGLSIDSARITQFEIRAYAGNVDDVVAGEDLFRGQIRLSLVPEPATYLIFGLGMATAVMAARRRRSLSSDNGDHRA